jgi:hypothetical protein
LRPRASACGSVPASLSPIIASTSPTTPSCERDDPQHARQPHHHILQHLHLLATSRSTVPTVTKSPLTLSLFRDSIEYLTINSDNFLFVEDGSPTPDVYYDSRYEPSPHGKTDVGISVRFPGNRTRLSGLPESTDDFDLPDTNSSRRHALDSCRLSWRPIPRAPSPPRCSG